MALSILRSFQEKEFYHPLLIWLMILCWYLLLGQNLLNSPETKLADIIDSQSFWLINEPPKETDHITIVTIDQTSRKNLGVKWPWHRQLTAKLVENIAALSPRAIGLDIIFSGISEEEQDQALISALGAHPGVVLGYTREETAENRPDDRFAAAASSMGFVDKPIDDGRIRNLTTFFRDGSDNLHLSMDVQLVKTFWRLDEEAVRATEAGLFLGNKAFVPSPKGRTPLNYLVYPTHFRMVPASRVINETADPSDFIDKIVLVGATDPLIHDEHPTVLGTLPGVTILGNGVVMVLSQRFLHAVPTGVGLFIALTLGYLILAVNRSLGFLRASVVSLGGLILVYLSFLLLRGQEIRLPYFMILFAGASAFLAYNGYKYISLLYVTNKIKHQAIFEPLTGLYTSRYFMLRLHERLKIRHGLTLVGMKLNNYHSLSVDLHFDQFKDVLMRISTSLIEVLNRHFTGIGASRLYPDIFIAAIETETAEKLEEFWKDLLEQLQETATDIGDGETGISVTGSFICKPKHHIGTESDIVAQMDRLLNSAEEGRFLLEELEERADNADTAVSRMDMLDFLAVDWEEKNKELEDHLKNVIETNKALDRLNWGTLNALARAIDAKSPWTAGHSERVTILALKIREAFGLDAGELENLRRGALLHDIGKIAISREILDKPGKLTDEEYEVICEHPARGAKILEPIDAYKGIIPIVRQHHEWFNGQGYPDHVAGDQIIPGARILAVADVYDALTSERPYREGMSHDRAIWILTEGKGTQFDPMVVDTFLKIALEERSERCVEATCRLNRAPEASPGSCTCTTRGHPDTSAPCLR